MEQKIFSKQEALQVIEQSARRQKFRKKVTIDLAGEVTQDALLSLGSEAGLDPEFIKMAIQELHELTRQSYVTDTHLIEEAELKNSTDLTLVWQEVISELKYRMKGSPKIESTKNKNEWIFEDRSGIKTLVNVRPIGDGIKLHLSRKIGFTKASVESIIGSTILALIVFGYSFVFLGTSLLDGILILLAVLLVSFLIIKKMNLSRRKKKQRRFKALTDQVVEQILYVNRRGEQEN